jgi:hypothetical protein
MENEKNKSMLSFVNIGDASRERTEMIVFLIWAVLEEAKSN